MKDTILKALSNINCFYSIIWMKATGKDKYTFREESKKKKRRISYELLHNEQQRVVTADP